MTFARIRAILQGVGSLLDVYPESNIYSKFVPKETPEERLHEAFVRVGDHIHAAMYVYDSNSKSDDP